MRLWLKLAAVVIISALIQYTLTTMRSNQQMVAQMARPSAWVLEFHAELRAISEANLPSEEKAKRLYDLRFRVRTDPEICRGVVVNAQRGF